MEKKVLAGAKLAGGNPENERVENDYYATNPEAVKMLLSKYDFFCTDNIRTVCRWWSYC